MNTEARSYHHGDLRAALLQAAQAELAEKGVEALTLRGIARRAGVSHAAPANHFSSLAALLSELAAIAFERLATAIRSECADETPGTTAHLIACAQGYVAFARANPALFRLMFRHERLDPMHARAVNAARDAFALPVTAVAALTGDTDPMDSPAPQAAVIALWSLTHGFAELLIQGQFDHLTGDDRDAWVHATIHRLIARSFPEAEERKPDA
ncbi:MAG: WHG domain-containing protein [Rhodobacteraceae bacterium]|nr:WHG domain-containing protein [Paracoccaceae bacterium]